MEHHQISKLLNNSTASKFETRKWSEVNDLLGAQNSVGRNIRFKTPVIKSHLCDYSDVYIVVKGTVTVESTSANNWIDKNVNQYSITHS